MVTESQARQADPLVQQIDSVNLLISQINAASAQGGWKPNFIVFTAPDGPQHNLELTPLSGPEILNSLWQMAQETLTRLENELAAI